MKRGLKPDTDKRMEAQSLRVKGLTYAAIGKVLGISRQRVQQLTRPPKEVYEYVKTRAHESCENCQTAISNGHIHHKLLAVDDYNDIDNLQYLCISCHQLKHYVGSRTAEHASACRYSETKRFSKRCNACWWLERSVKGLNK